MLINSFANIDQFVWSTPQVFFLEEFLEEDKPIKSILVQYIYTWNDWKSIRISECIRKVVPFLSDKRTFKRFFHFESFLQADFV